MRLYRISEATIFTFGRLLTHPLRKVMTVIPSYPILCLSPGYDGAHMVHPLAWPTQLVGSPASPQRAGRWSPWTPEKGR